MAFRREKGQVGKVDFSLAAYFPFLGCIMFIQLKHQDMLVVTESRKLLFEVYKLILIFPPEEKYAMSAQLRRAMLSVYLNINEGCSRVSPLERKRFFEISRGSLIEVDAIFEIATGLNYLKGTDLNKLSTLLLSSFRLLSNLIRSTNK